MYRKYKPTSIFTGNTMLQNGNVLILNGNLSVEAIVAESEAGDGIESLEGILSPGFVNAHCHIELSHMKGMIPKHTGLAEFVKQVILQRESHYSESFSEEHFETFLDFKHTAMNNAVQELYSGGTVAVADICNSTDSLELKKGNFLYWHNFVEVSGFVDAVADKRFASATRVLEAFAKSLPSSGNSITPHSPYSVSKTLFNLLNDCTGGQIISIHNQETQAENELYLKKAGQFLKLYEDLGINIDSFLPTGKTSFASWIDYFNNDQKIISVHNSFITADDLLTVASEMPIYFCLCINANLYIENSVPPIDMLMQNNCSILLGTDSYASNSHLSMMEEIKAINKYFPHIGLETMLQWATLNGAKALGISDQYGSFEKGKTPGLVLINGGRATRID